MATSICDCSEQLKNPEVWNKHLIVECAMCKEEHIIDCSEMDSFDPEEYGFNDAYCSCCEYKRLQETYGRKTLYAFQGN